MINKYKHFVYFLFICIVKINFSQSIQDLQKLKSEYEKFNKEKIDFEPIREDRLESSPMGTPKTAEFIPYTPDISTDIVKSKFFAYDYFTIRDTTKFWENLPTPANYQLGPGDELIISVWGETQLRKTYTISREGKIYDETVGLLNLGGKNIKDASDYIKSQFGRIYATLISKNPTSFIDLSLGDLQSINVNFVGQINYPGIYPIHPFSTLITGLIQSGGVDTTGSLRNIQIIRNGEEPNIIDLYDYFIKGKLSSSIQLRDQDIILVPPRRTLITIDSSVVRPGLYESIQGETIMDMINYAGGLSYDASQKIGIKRLIPISDRVNGKVFESSYIDYNSSSLVSVNNGDEIIAQKIFKEIDEVEIIGQVKSPGKYHFFEGMTFLDIIDLSGGFEDATFLKSVYLEKAKIIRRNPDTRYEKVISINLKEIIAKKSGSSILLQNLDRIVIHANLNFFEKENILISGEVFVPGSYPLIRDEESLSSLISRAGGLTSNALENGIAIYRESNFFENNQDIPSSLYPPINQNNTKDDEIIISNKKTDKIRVAWQNMNISLMPGDSIIVKEKTGAIYVTGAVYNPGVLEFRGGKSLRYYLNSAGGLTQLGNERGIIVLYPNGLVSPKKLLVNPKITEGSTIIVNEKIPEEPFDVTQFATNWTSIISSMITAIVLSKQL